MVGGVSVSSGSQANHYIPRNQGFVRSMGLVELEPVTSYSGNWMHWGHGSCLTVMFWCCLTQCLNTSCFRGVSVVFWWGLHDFLALSRACLAVSLSCLRGLSVMFWWCLTVMFWRGFGHGDGAAMECSRHVLVVSRSMFCLCLGLSL